MKKVLSVVVAVLLLFAMAAFCVSAADAEKVAAIGTTKYETVSAAIAAAKAGDTIKLIADVKENVTINKNITLDGSGPDKSFEGKITIAASKVTIQNIKFFDSLITKTTSKPWCNLTVKNCTFSGTLDNGYAMKLGYVDLTVENCLAKDVALGFVYIYKSSNNISAKDVTVNGASYGFHVAYSNNCSFENVNLLNVKYGYLIQTYAAKSVSFKDCSTDAEYPIKIWERSKTMQTIYDIGDNNFGEGAFDFEGQEDYVTVIRIPYVFAIGETKYFTLSEATAAAVDGDVIKVIEDYEFDSAAAVAATEVDGEDWYSFGHVVDKKITIDLNGKAVKFNGNTDGVVLGVVTVDGTGDVTLVDSSEAKTGAFEITAGDAGVYSLLTTLSSEAKLTVESGRYAADEVKEGWSLVYSAGNETVTVNGGDFYLGNADYDYWWVNNPELYAWIFNAKGDGVKAIVVTGGTYNADPTHYHGEVRYPTCMSPVEVEEDSWEIAVVHTPGDAATCQAPQICTVCKEELDEIKDHSFENYVSDNNATCEADGTKTAECIYGCGKKATVTDEGSKKAHTPGDAIVCQAPQTCTVCGTELTEVQPHTFGEYVSDNNASCGVNGTKTAECIYGCGTKDTVIDEGSMKTHTDADGNKYCDICNDKYCEVCGGMHDSFLSDVICALTGFIRLIVSFFETVI